ncbi:MAG TPA: XRE family transcriptional regulator [Clostridiales bacterium]|nr:XRE family transcriptional regulator [Clostridiales bacterium]
MSSNMMDIKYSQRIRELMKEEKVNQVILSQKIGVVQSTISAWLNGKKEPSIKSLWLLADFFQVSIDYIVGRVEF